jgi:ribonuclease HI
LRRISSESARKIALAQLEIAERSPGLRGYFDGCTEPINPGGTAGWGAVIFDGPRRLWEDSGFLPPSPTTSNNIAEYLAVTAILERLTTWGLKTPATVFGDSRLVICQLWGWPAGSAKWKINGVDPGRQHQPKGHYADTAVRARALLAALPTLRGHWIPRDKNDVADDLSKSHLRRLGVEFRIQPEGEEQTQ